MKNRVICAAMLLIVAGGAATAVARPSGLGLLFPFDSTGNPAGDGWIQSMAPNDDQSSAQIDIGFDFCFYGQNRRNLFVNNNGNLSFDNPYFQYSPTGFPDTQFQMIAPFWGDVDTRNRDIGNEPTNLVWHRSLDTNGDMAPDTFVTTWDNVGYYGNHNELRNTFQCAITINPALFGGGRNVAFSYGDMQWTTGDASGGAGGFGGSPATVGINQGNGVDFFQVGRFDHAGNDYDGSQGNNDGVSFLDNQDFFFNICGVANLPPVAIGIPAGGCFTVDANGVLNSVITLIGPENGDAITSIAVNDLNGAQAAGLTIIANTGTPGTVQLLWNPDNGDIGMYNFDLTFVDSFNNTTVEHFCINVVPAPTAAGLLAMGGLLAARRRRR